VARFLIGLSRRYAEVLRLSVAEVNGQPALLARRVAGDALFAVLVPEFDGPEIVALHIVTSPHKLAFAVRQMAVTKSRPE